MPNATVFLKTGYINAPTFSFDRHEFFLWDCLNSTGSSEAFYSSSGRSSSGSAKLLSSYFGSFTEHELESEEDMRKMSF